MDDANVKGMNTARVTVDALAGQGMVLFEGAIVRREALAEYFDALVESGALEICEPEPLRFQGMLK